MAGVLAFALWLGWLFWVFFPAGADIAPLWEGTRRVIAEIAGDPVLLAMSLLGVFVAYMAWKTSR